MDVTTMGVVLGLYALVLWILLIFAWRRGYQEWKTNRANRLRKFEARVMDKREVTRAEDLRGQPTVEHLVAFEFGGRQEEFGVEARIYLTARVGQEGTLRLKSGKFTSFEPKSADEETGDVYRRMVKD